MNAIRVFDEYTHFVLTDPLARVTLWANDDNTKGGWFIMLADKEVRTGYVDVNPKCVGLSAGALAREAADAVIAEIETELEAK